MIGNEEMHGDVDGNRNPRGSMRHDPGLLTKVSACYRVGKTESSLEFTIKV